MSKMQVFRALVVERLTAAAEDIFRLTTHSKMLHTPEISPEQQRTIVHKRLAVVAEEIYRILEIMMSDYEEEEAVEHQHKLLDLTMKTATNVTTADSTVLVTVSPSNSVIGPDCIQRPSDLIKDAATETDSQIHQTQGTEKATSAIMGEVTQQDQSEVPQAEGGNAESDSGEELKDRKTAKSNKRKPIPAKLGKIATKTAATGQSCCRVCGKCFRYRRSFLKHVLIHEMSTPVCGVCGKHLNACEELKVHLQTHNEENSCRDQTEEKQAEVDCSNAESKAGDSDEDWKEPEATDSDDADSDTEGTKVRGQNKPKKDNGDSKDVSHLKYSCKVCDKAFCYRASFLKHVQEEERSTELCGVCGKRFNSEDSLRLHLQTYVLTNDCEVCGKHFDGHTQLEMHMRTHTGEKPYVCTVCGKAFAQNGNLMAHMRVHTGERPYACSVCGQSFSFKEYMMAHVRIHTGEKPFLCNFCGKGFRQRGTLRTHMIMHTGEFKHQCIICDKKFYKSGALKIHMRSHTGEKPYLCNVCGKSFSAGGSLAKHMGAHRGEQTHRCSICGKGFPRKEDVERHTETHGGESAHVTSF